MTYNMDKHNNDNNAIKVHGRHYNKLLCILVLMLGSSCTRITKRFRATKGSVFGWLACPCLPLLSIWLSKHFKMYVYSNQLKVLTSNIIIENHDLPVQFFFLSSRKSMKWTWIFLQLSDSGENVWEMHFWNHLMGSITTADCSVTDFNLKSYCYL